jgi:acyl-CoA synthetase (AMP-forming)/AMP-acid ligase II
MNLAQLLFRTARLDPSARAIVHGASPFADYGALAQRCGALAASLRARFCLHPGDRVAILMKNCPDYLVALYGAWWAGLAAVPVNAKLHPKEVHYILENSGAKLVFITPDWASAIEEALQGLAAKPAIIETGTAEYAKLLQGPPAPMADVEPADLAWLFYTSGTTGRPKGAMLSHRNLMQMTFNYFTDVDSIASGDCILHAAPMSHGSGLYNFAHVLRGAGQVIPESGGFDEAEICDLMLAHAGMSFFAAPTMVKRLTEHVRRTGADTSRLKTIVYGGGPMYVADIQQSLAAFGSKFVQIYGQGESPMTITALSKVHLGNTGHPRYLQRIGSVGVAQSGVLVRVRDEQGVALPSGEVGEVCVKGDVVMSGYWNSPEATAKTVRDGWLWTGDMGEFDEDGFLTLKDRSRDLIISGGSNIYPREVEEVLLRHLGVAEASVVGRPHPEWGEEVVAFVVTKRGTAVAIEELDKLCLEHIARFKRPKEYRFVDALPKNNYGKVLKTELRRYLDAG